MKLILLAAAAVTAVLCGSSLDRTPPHLFVIGDSISMHYGPYLRDALGDAYRYDRKRGRGQAWEDLDQPIGANGGDSERVLAYMRSLASDSASFAPDLLLVNCGLHDIKTKPGEGTRQVEPEAYASNLRAIVELAVAEDWPLAFVLTTPAIDSIHNRPGSGFHRHAADVDLYNTIARAIMREYEVPLIDLYRFSANFPHSSFKDHVHYHPEYRQRQGDFIAGHLLAWLGKGPGKE